nr:ubiquinol oxidase subunit II [Buchnera aphidicola]
MFSTEHGIIAKQEYSLILISFVMMMFVIIPVFFMTIYFSVKYRASNINEIYKPNWSESKIIEIIVWIVPILIISFLALLTWNYCHILDPQKPISSKYKPIKIDVIALDWRWLFIYPEYGIASINEIAFPTNKPVMFRITSNSVMNSFFIPSLGSQIYAMPGMVTKLNLISNDSGKYKGISSNYSGKGFSNMKFTVISLPDKKTFINWINKVKNSPKKLNTMKMFNKVSSPNENHYVEYFSHVDKTLLSKIIH